MIPHTQKDRRKLSPGSRKVMALADRPGGVTTQEAMVAAELLSLTSTGSWLSKKVREGFLFGIKRWRNSRYFTCPNAALAWAKENPASTEDKPRPSNWSLNLPNTRPPHLHRKNQVVPQPEAHAPTVTIGKRKHVEHSGPHPEPKFTLCPSPKFDARFQVDPQSRPAGAGFAAAGVGRYLEA